MSSRDQIAVRLRFLSEVATPYDAGFLRAAAELILAGDQGEWKPISEAPRDETWFLALRDDGSMVVAFRYNPSSRTDEILSVPGRWAQNATHYRSLPSPPSLQGEDNRIVRGLRDAVEGRVARTTEVHVKRGEGR